METIVLKCGEMIVQYIHIIEIIHWPYNMIQQLAKTNQLFYFSESFFPVTIFFFTDSKIYIYKLHLNMMKLNCTFYLKQYYSLKIKLALTYFFYTETWISGKNIYLFTLALFTIKMFIHYFQTYENKKWQKKFTIAEK